VKLHALLPSEIPFDLKMLQIWTYCMVVADYFLYSYRNTVIVRSSDRVYYD
jgi:hypothetical protein